MLCYILKSICRPAVLENQIPRSKLTGYLTLAAFAKCSCKHGTWLITRGNQTDADREERQYVDKSGIER